MKRYKITGKNRKVNAIGIFQDFTEIVTAEDENSAREIARKNRYNNNYEHVTIISVMEIK